jgi:hypothetical protein
MTADNHAYRSLALPRTAPGHRRLELLSALFHAIYQREAHRQAEQGADAVRHDEDYYALPEHTKDYDRALALFFMSDWPGGTVNVDDSELELMLGEILVSDNEV